MGRDKPPYFCAEVHMKRIFAVACLLAVLCLSGCATTKLMPSSDDETVGDVGWKNYAEAEKFYNEIRRGVTTVDDLSTLGLNLKTSKNVMILDRTTLLALFMANVPGSFEYIDDAVKQCLKFSESCTPYVFRKDESKEEGKGSLLLRMLNFKKESIVRGWNVEMLILVHNNLVVYKQIKGTPNGTERNKLEKHPLGPLDGTKLGGGLIRPQ